MSDDWKPLFTRETPFAALGPIIDEQIKEAIVIFRRTLLEETNLSDESRARLVADKTPQIARDVRTQLENAWTRLQSTQ